MLKQYRKRIDKKNFKKCLKWSDKNSIEEGKKTDKTRCKGMLQGEVELMGKSLLKEKRENRNKTE